VALLLLVAVVGKSAQFPLHTWLPDAMPGPTPVSALIHAATMVAAGVYLLARMLPLVQSSAVATAVLGLVACLTMLMGAAFALAGDDVKRILAWSTVSQLAYMFAALAVGSALAATGHLLVHGRVQGPAVPRCRCLAHAVGSTAISAMGRPAALDALDVLVDDRRTGRALVGWCRRPDSSARDAVLGSALEATHHEDGRWLAWTVPGGLLPPC
jgi:NADH-quinone oxidoreductase subunit L